MEHVWNVPKTKQEIAANINLMYCCNVNTFPDQEALVLHVRVAPALQLQVDVAL